MQIALSSACVLSVDELLTPSRLLKVERKIENDLYLRILVFLTVCHKAHATTCTVYPISVRWLMYVYTPYIYIKLVIINMGCLFVYKKHFSQFHSLKRGCYIITLAGKHWAIFLSPPPDYLRQSSSSLWQRQLLVFKLLFSNIQIIAPLCVKPKHRKCPVMCHCWFERIV